MGGEGARAGEFGKRFRGVEGEDVREAGGLVEEGLQLGVGLQDGGGDEDVWVAQDEFGFLADEVEEFIVAKGGGGSPGVD